MSKNIPLNQQYKLDAKSQWLFFLPVFLRFFVVWLAMLLFLGGTPLNEVFGGRGAVLAWAGVIVLLLGTLSYAWAWLSYYFYRYEMADTGFRKESGILFKRYVTIPYERIQNININRNPVERVLGLSSVHIFTAGTASFGGGVSLSAEGRLPGVSRKTAEMLRDQLVEQSRLTRNKGM